MERVFKPKFQIPQAAKRDILGHDVPGMIVWRNAFNNFVVAAVHYTADPEKRSQEWFKMATENMRVDQVDREMEIDFESRAGQKAFWFLQHHEDRYRIPNIPLDQVPKHWRIIAGLDYGTREPTAVILFGIDEYRRFYALHEFYKPSNYREIARFIKGEHEDFPHPLWKRIEKVVADPSIFRKDQEDPTDRMQQAASSGEIGKEELRSRADLLREEGIWNLYRGVNDRMAGWERLRELFNHFPNRESKPAIFFCERCEKTWWEFTNLVYEELAPHQMMEKNGKEDIKQFKDHAADATRYACLSIEAPSEKPVIDTLDSLTLDSIEKQLNRSHTDNQDDFY